MPSDESSEGVERCPECDEQLRRDPPTGKWLCDNCERSFSDTDLDGVAADGGGRKRTVKDRDGWFPLDYSGGFDDE